MRALRAGLIVTLALAVAAGPSAAWAHDDVATEAGHAAEDAVVHTAAGERALSRNTRAVTAGAARAAALAVDGPPNVTGTWGPVVDWPVVAVHVALLPNG